MKKTLLILGVSLALFACKKEAAQEDIIGYASTITSNELKEKLYTYASDEHEGRETGSPGQQKALDYIKNHYEALNIPSAVAPDNYFQEVPLNNIKTPEVSLTVNGTSFNYFEDFISQTSAATGEFSASEIVYAGFGINHENTNDYKDLDVKGKIVVVKSGEPQDKDGNFLVSGTKEISKWSNGRQAISAKRSAAKDNGAKALFFMDDALFSRYSKLYKARHDKGTSRSLSLPKKDKAEQIYHFLISEKLGNALVSNINDTESSAVVKSDITVNYKSISVPLPSANVAAIIKGSEKPEEYIIISSHSDHIGIATDGQINNGADDDGSGSVAVLEIAEAFKAAADKGQGPKRSIVFLHVTGEERGLLGSRYYTDFSPLFPLENTVANLNIDMIGRVDPKRESDNRNYLYIIGSDKLSTELHNISEEVNETFTNIEFDYTYNDENDPNRFYYRSDHYNFAKNNIPIIFYFNGTHDDYHRPTDTPDKIEYDLLENRTRLVFHTAWELANREDRIVADKVTK